MHFSLRTLLVAATAVAIYVGGSLGILRTVNGWAGASGLGFWNGVHVFFGLPLFVLWAFAVVWAFERRERPGVKLLFWGLAFTAAWRLVALLVQMSAFHFMGIDGSNQLFFYAAFELFNGLIETASWAVLFFAFVKASESRPASVSPWEDPSPTDAVDR
jgi:hypothetical protein